MTMNLMRAGSHRKGCVGPAVAIVTGQNMVEILHEIRGLIEAVTKVMKKTGSAGAATPVAAYFLTLPTRSCVNFACISCA